MAAATLRTTRVTGLDDIVDAGLRATAFADVLGVGFAVAWAPACADATPATALTKARM